MFSLLYVAVDDLVRNYRLGILRGVKRPRPNSRLRPKLRPPVDFLSIDARTFAEQLTYMDAVSTSSNLRMYVHTYDAGPSLASVGP